MHIIGHVVPKLKGIMYCYAVCVIFGGDCMLPLVPTDSVSAIAALSNLDRFARLKHRTRDCDADKCSKCSHGKDAHAQVHIALYDATIMLIRVELMQTSSGVWYTQSYWSYSLGTSSVHLDISNLIPLLFRCHTVC